MTAPQQKQDADAAGKGEERASRLRQNRPCQ